MLSVIIPTLNNEATLPRALSCLVPAAVAGLVREVVIADAGSADRSGEIADDTGADLLLAPAGRGAQLAAGAAHARGDWLLFLQPESFLEPGWALEVEAFIARAEQSPGGKLRAAAVFRYAVDDFGPSARRREWLVGLRNHLLALPYGDQGLLIHRQLYTQLGGFAADEPLADVAFIRKLGRSRILCLRSAAISIAPDPARRSALRLVRGFMAAVLHALRVPTRVIARLHS